MGGCRSADVLKLEADKLCQASNLALQDFQVANACFAGGFESARYTCCGRPPVPMPTPPSPVCKVDTDCRLVTGGCGQAPCTCSARGVGQPEDSCAMPAIACLVDPCANLVAACINGQCQVQRPTRP